MLWPAPIVLLLLSGCVVGDRGEADSDALPGVHCPPMPDGRPGECRPTHQLEAVPSNPSMVCRQRHEFSQGPARAVELYDLPDQRVGVWLDLAEDVDGILAMEDRFGHFQQKAGGTELHVMEHGSPRHWSVAARAIRVTTPPGAKWTVVGTAFEEVPWYYVRVENETVVDHVSIMWPGFVHWQPAGGSYTTLLGNITVTMPQSSLLSSFDNYPDALGPARCVLDDLLRNGLDAPARLESAPVPLRSSNEVGCGASLPGAHILRTQCH